MKDGVETLTARPRHRIGPCVGDLRCRVVDEVEDDHSTIPNGLAFGPFNDPDELAECRQTVVLRLYGGPDGP